MSSFKSTPSWTSTAYASRRRARTPLSSPWSLAKTSTTSAAILNLRQVRFEVTNGAKLLWETNVHFHGTEIDQDVDGGGTFRFLNNLEMTDVGARSVPEQSPDLASYQLSGGGVYSDDHFRVDGEATITSCEVAGCGESSPGPGGALYVGEQGSVLFNGALEISGVSITDDEGNTKGKLNIKGDATFDDLQVESGGAIYNAAGGQFKFKNGATILFTDCSVFNGIAAALYNQGLFKLFGQAVFVNTEAPSIYVGSTGNAVLSENSSFGASDDTSNPAILVFREAGSSSPTLFRSLETPTPSAVRCTSGTMRLACTFVVTPPPPITSFPHP